MESEIFNEVANNNAVSAFIIAMALLGSGAICCILGHFEKKREDRKKDGLPETRERK